MVAALNWALAFMRFRPWAFLGGVGAGLVVVFVLQRVAPLNWWSWLVGVVLLMALVLGVVGLNRHR